MDPEKPTPQHAWLQRLVGEWTSEAEVDCGGSPMTSKGRERVRAYGGFWTIGDGVGEMPGGTPFESIITLGYDPLAKRFVGSFIASTMSHFWIYNGSLDAAGKVLTLDADGPSFAGDGTLAHYQDIFTFESDDVRTLRSQVQGPDGSWTQFMKATYRRVR